MPPIPRDADLPRRGNSRDGADGNRFSESAGALRDPYGPPRDAQDYVPNASANGLGHPPDGRGFPATTRLVTAPRGVPSYALSTTEPQEGPPCLT